MSSLDSFSEALECIDKVFENLEIRTNPERPSTYPIRLSGEQPRLLESRLVEEASALTFAHHDHRREDPDACKLVVYYIVHGSLPRMLVATDDANNYYQKFLSSAWCLCNCYEIPKLQNLIMEKLLKLTHTSYTNMDHVMIAFTYTKLGSPLRMLMAEQVVCDIRAKREGYSVLREFRHVPGAWADIQDALLEWYGN